MQKGILFVAILYLIQLGSCKPKDEPQEQIGIPVFSMNGFANDAAISIVAGVDGYFMNTDFNQTPNGVFTFNGKLSQQSCTSCRPELAISFTNYTVQTPFNIDSSLLVKTYPFYNQQQPVLRYYELQCTALPFGIGVPIIGWDFGNAKFSSDQNVTTTFKQDGIYSINCSAVFPNGCFSILTQPVYLTPTRVGKQTDFTINYIDSQTLLFNSIPVNKNAIVTWDFGDSKVGEGSIVPHSYNSKGLYKVCMTYINGQDTMQFCKNVNTLNVTSCKSNFNFSSKLIIDSFQFSTVNIEWKDETGKQFSSGLVDQPSESKFQVLQVSPFLLNEKGQKTKQLSIQFTCLVSDGNQIIELKNMKGVIAIAYP
jgi:PKD repeat protein